MSLGPGKADILEGIAVTGSIAAAGRRMRMSYKRAWSLVEALNATFAEPLVTSSRGGEKGGGAALTPAGARPCWPIFVRSKRPPKRPSHPISKR